MRFLIMDKKTKTLAKRFLENFPVILSKIIGFGIFFGLYLVFTFSYFQSKTDSDPTSQPEPERIGIKLNRPPLGQSNSTEPIPHDAGPRLHGYSFSNDGQKISGLIVQHLSLPLENRTEPLPHNGLFFRRNNHFGTRVNVGIKELVDDGIQIDQTNITFSDFVPIDTEGVPLPKSGNSLAVTYGITPIPDHQRRNNKATHYLEVAFRTAKKVPEGQRINQSPPVNYIFVIDTSGSMYGDKIDTVKASIRELFKGMKADDVIGIIEFNDQPKTILKATPVKDINPNEFSQMISNLTTDGGTDINSGLLYGITELSRHESETSVNQVFLFSDGNPTSGETNWLKIRQNIDQRRGNTILSTFAFGTDAEIRELDALAGLTGGQSNFISDSDDLKNLTLVLEEELSRREHLAAINVQMKIELEENVSIWHLYGHDQVTEPAYREAILQNIEKTKDIGEEKYGVASPQDIVTDEDGIRIFVPNLAVDEIYLVVLELEIPKNHQKQSIGKTTVQYVDTLAQKSKKYQFSLLPNGDLPNTLISQHALALWTSEVTFFALDDLYLQDFKTAESRIQNHVTVLELANDQFSSQLIQDDIITLNKFLTLAYNLGKPKAMSDQNQIKTVATYQLNTFGQVRNGFQSNNYR